jgi:hypothetical protein
MKKICLIFASLLLLNGCASNFTQFPQRREQLTTKTYNSSFDKTFDAIVKVIEKMGFPLKQADKQTGIIETGERTRRFGIMGFPEKAYAHITKVSDNSTEVRVNLRWEGDERWLLKEYQSIFEEIDKELAANTDSAN